MKYPSPPAHSIPSSTSPQLLDNNYSLFVFHVFYISSFRWQCNGAFLRKSHKVYPSVVWRLIWVSADQTIEKLGVLACTWESQWDLLRTNAGQVKPSICHSQLIGLAMQCTSRLCLCTATSTVSLWSMLTVRPGIQLLGGCAEDILWLPLWQQSHLDPCLREK